MSPSRGPIAEPIYPYIVEAYETEHSLPAQCALFSINADTLENAIALARYTLTPTFQRDAAILTAPTYSHVLERWTDGSKRPVRSFLRDLSPELREEARRLGSIADRGLYVTEQAPDERRRITEVTACYDGGLMLRDYFNGECFPLTPSMKLEDWRDQPVTNPLAAVLAMDAAA